MTCRFKYTPYISGRYIGFWEVHLKEKRKSEHFVGEIDIDKKGNVAGFVNDYDYSKHMSIETMQAITDKMKEIQEDVVK